MRLLAFDNRFKNGVVEGEIISTGPLGRIRLFCVFILIGIVFLIKKEAVVIADMLAA